MKFRATESFESKQTRTVRVPVADDRGVALGQIVKRQHAASGSGHAGIEQHSSIVIERTFEPGGKPAKFRLGSLEHAEAIAIAILEAIHEAAVTTMAWREGAAIDGSAPGVGASAAAVPEQPNDQERS